MLERRIATLAIAGLCAGAGAQSLTEARIVEAQGAYARAQLGSIAAILSAAPAAAAREAFQSGNATIDWRRYSPGLGSIARGPTLKESLAPLLSNIAASKMGCVALEGSCQNQAAASGRDAALRVLGSEHPGKALLAALAEDTR
jgi:hypothetical protein